jgi:formyltetrahydrofolate synthetase
MAVIVATAMTGPGVRVLTETTMTASDTLAYDTGRPNSVLVLRNPTGGALSPTITGSLASAAIAVPGFGTVSAAAGLAVGSIAAGAARVIPLDSINLYLVGTVTITAGTGLVASFLQY